MLSEDSDDGLRKTQEIISDIERGLQWRAKKIEKPRIIGMKEEGSIETDISSFTMGQ